MVEKGKIDAKLKPFACKKGTYNIKTLFGTSLSDQ